MTVEHADGTASLTVNQRLVPPLDRFFVSLGRYRFTPEKPAVLTISMIVLMMRTARRLKGEIETKVGALAGNSSRFGLFAFVFLMVLREGVETVLILAGVSFNSTELMNFIGTLTGVMLAILFGVMFVKGSVRINLQKFFRVTTVILFFVSAQLIISGLHELSENGVLPSSKREMAIIGERSRQDGGLSRDCKCRCWRVSAVGTMESAPIQSWSNTNAFG